VGHVTFQVRVGHITFQNAQNESRHIFFPQYFSPSLHLSNVFFRLTTISNVKLGHVTFQNAQNESRDIFCSHFFPRLHLSNLLTANYQSQKGSCHISKCSKWVMLHLFCVHFSPPPSRQCPSLPSNRSEKSTLQSLSPLTFATHHLCGNTGLVCSNTRLFGLFCSNTLCLLHTSSFVSETEPVL
jgi:hypothetical protein